MTIAKAPMNLDRIAETISKLLHPLAVPVPAGVIILLLDGTDLLTAIGWVAVIIISLILPMAGLVAYLRKFHGLDTDRRSPRNILYPLGLFFAGLTAGLLYYLSAPEIILTGIYIAILSGIAGLAINRKTKISLHVGVMSGIAATAFYVDFMAGVSALVLALLAGWSRIQLDHHTLNQVLLGLSVPLASAAVVFWII